MVVEEQAFAKINLTLDVLSKRGDGYHSIASVMQTIDLCDTLFLSESSEPGVQLSCESHIAEEIPEGEANLAWRGASMALKAIAETGRQTAPGHSLRLVKRIPAQAGLGGGSSDAAAALRAVNVLHGKVLRAEGLL
ncbi:MAG TPA: hypothetical protein VGS41_14180, partial [Chthonomonadales bacterium]|nr:hypothetical protein [Chthonomonadales bacterium]